MVDSLKLSYFIKKAGYTNKDCAEKLGISYQGFLNKLNNVSEFKYSEIVSLAEMLSLSIEDKVFFQPKG